MSAVQDLFSIISPEEHAQFIRYLNARNRRSDVKNVALFKAMMNGTENRLKSELGANAFNVLRNRLKHRMIDFIAQKIIGKEGGTENRLMKPFLTAQQLMKNGKVHTAFKLLTQLEREANEGENFVLTGEIQQVLIRHAHLSGAPNLDELHERSSRNLQLQQAYTQLNLAFARIKLAYQAVEFEGEKVDISDLIESTFLEFAVSDDIACNF